MAGKKTYDKEYKVQAVKLGREVGFSKAAKELCLAEDTLDILRQIVYNLPVLIVCLSCFNDTPSAASWEAVVVFFPFFRAASPIRKAALHLLCDFREGPTHTNPC